MNWIFLLMVMSLMLRVQSEDVNYGPALVSIGEGNEVMSQKLSLLLNKQTQLEDQLKTESGAKRNAAAGKVGKIFAAIRYAQFGCDGAAMLTSAEILGDLLSLTKFLPGLGPLISQVASGFISLFFNPTQGSIIQNALENQYHLELEMDASGIFDVIDNIRVDLEHLEDVVYSDKLTWDEGADDTLQSIHTGTRYTEITAFMGKIQKVIIDKLESIRQSMVQSMLDQKSFEYTVPMLKHVNLYFTLTEYLEVQFIRLAILVETGLIKEPTLQRFQTVISKMRDHWIPDLHANANKLLKYFLEPELKNIHFVLAVHARREKKAETSLIRYLKRKEAQLLSKHEQTPLENGDIIEIWKDGIPMNAKCPSKSPLCEAEFSGARNDIVWILEDVSPYMGQQIRSATTRLNVLASFSAGFEEHFLLRQILQDMRQLIIRMNDSECGHHGKKYERQCYVIIMPMARCNKIFDTCDDVMYTDLLNIPFSINTVIIKKASQKLTFKKSDVAKLSRGSKFCLTPCAPHGYSYQWCRVESGKWDYCSTSEGFTSRNKKCKTPRKNKYWCENNDFCYTTDGSWDYCSVVNIDKYFKTFSDQPDTFSYVGRCQGEGRDSDTVMLEDQATEMRCYKQCFNNATATGCEFSKTGKCVMQLDKSLTVDGNKDYRCFVFNTRVGYCVDSNKRDVNEGDTVLTKSKTAQHCYEQCKKETNVTACEFQKNNGKCTVHTKEVAKGNGNQNYVCWVL